MASLMVPLFTFVVAAMIALSAEHAAEPQQHGIARWLGSALWVVLAGLGCLLAVMGRRCG